MRVLLVALLLLPAASAVTWDDDTSDQRLGYATHYENGEPSYHWVDAGEQGWYEVVDIVSATVDETASDIVFTLIPAGTGTDGPPAGPEFNEFVHGFSYEYKGETRHVAFFTDRGDTPIIAHARSFEIFGSNIVFPSGWLRPAMELDGGGWRGSLPKDTFRDENQIPMREGDVMEDIRVFAHDNDFFNSGPLIFGPPCAEPEPTGPALYGPCPWTAVDEMDGSSFTVELTPPGVGHVFLRIDEPYRLSNGLATTYLFEADLHNLEAIDDTIVLQVSDLPNGWEVRHPATATFSGKGSQTIPIALTVPFSHQHGNSHYMRLSAISQHNESAIVESQFGIIFADPPQPAGHHDTLWFYGIDYCDGNFGGCAQATMNAGSEPSENRWGRPVDEIPGDAGFRSPFTEPAQPAVRSWDIWLDPSLGIGLDFDLSRQGTLAVDIRFDDDWAGTLDAALMLERYDWENDDWSTTKLGSGQTDVTAGAGSTQSLQLAMDFLPAADLIPYQSGQNLVLLLNATDTSGVPGYLKNGDATLLTPESWMQLPLIDYHEEVDLSGLDFAELTIERLNGTFRYVNPGGTTVFGFKVGNVGPTATIDWELVGQEDMLDWATLTPASSRVPTDGNATVVVRVQPPADAEEGDVLELLLVGTERETGTPLYGRLTAYVTTEIELEDESAVAEQLEKEAAETADGKDSPLPLLLVVAGLGLAVLRRRL